MQRIPSLKVEEAPEKSQPQLEMVAKKLGGFIPNLYTSMAHAPAALQAMLGFGMALNQSSHLPAKMRELIALAVGEKNGCTYCVAAHTGLAKAAGATVEETLAARRGRATDAPTQAAITLALTINEHQGHVDDDALAAARNAGFSDGEILDILAVTVQNIYTNYANHLIQTELDFPAAPPLNEQ